MRAATSSRPRRTSRSSSTSRPARCTRRTTSPREWIEPLPRPLRRRLGGVARRASSRARSRAGIVPAGTALHRAPAVGRRSGTRSPPTSGGCYARMMEVFAGFLAHTDAPDRPAARLPRARSALLDDTLVLLHLRQRRERRGRPDRLVQRAPLHARPARRPRRAPRAHRRARRLPRRTTTTVGLGVGGQHAAAAVEALHVARRRAHAADRALARRHRRRAARCATQFCHAVDLMPTVLDAAGIERARRGRRRRRSSRSTARVAARHVRRRRRRPTPAHDAVLRDARQSRAIYHDGWKATTDHVGAQLTVEQRAARGQPRLRRRPLGAVRPRRRLLRVARRRRRAPRRGRARSRSCGGPRPGATRCCRSTTRFIGRAVAMEPAPYAPAAPHRLPAGRRRVAEDVLPPLGARLPARSPTSRCPTAAPTGRAVRARRLDQRLGARTCSTAGRSRAFNLFGDATAWSPAPTPLAAGRPRARARPTPERRRPVALLVDGERSATASCPADLPFRWQIGGGRAAASAATAASRCATTTSRRSPSPASCARSPSRSRCSPPTTPPSRSPPPSGASDVAFPGLGPWS